MGKGRVTGDVADNQPDTIASNALHYGAAHANRVSRPLHSIPANRTTECSSAIEEQYSPAFGRNHVEDEPQELPLQRFLVPDAPNARGDLQQCIQIERHSGCLWQARGYFVRL